MPIQPKSMTVEMNQLMQREREREREEGETRESFFTFWTRERHEEPDSNSIRLMPSGVRTLSIYGQGV